MIKISASIVCILLTVSTPSILLANFSGSETSAHDHELIDSENQPIRFINDKYEYTKANLPDLEYYLKDLTEIRIHIVKGEKLWRESSGKIDNAYLVNLKAHHFELYFPYLFRKGEGLKSAQETREHYVRFVNGVEDILKQLYRYSEVPNSKTTLAHLMTLMPNSRAEGIKNFIELIKDERASSIAMSKLKRLNYQDSSLLPSLRHILAKSNSSYDLVEAAEYISSINSGDYLTQETLLRRIGQNPVEDSMSIAALEALEKYFWNDGLIPKLNNISSVTSRDVKNRIQDIIALDQVDGPFHEKIECKNVENEKCRSYISMIESTIPKNLQIGAKSLLKNAYIEKVTIEQGRVVVAIQTRKLRAKVTVNNGRNSFSKTTRLESIVSIPFPNGEDVKYPDDYMSNYWEFAKQYDIFPMAAEGLGGKKSILEFRFSEITHSELFGANQRILLGATINPTWSSFDFNNEEFSTNGCDEAACWGSYGIDVELSR